MKTIYKYPIQDMNLHVSPFIKLPKDAQILSVQYQGEDLCVWALVDPDSNIFERVEFKIVGTGFDLEDEDLENYEYLETVQTKSHSFVWHIFRKKF